LTPLLRSCQKALTNKFWWGYWRECRRQGRGGEGEERRVAVYINFAVFVRWGC
jgi:hypothetical protein